MLYYLAGISKVYDYADKRNIENGNITYEMYLKGIRLIKSILIVELMSDLEIKSHFITGATIKT